MAGDVFGIVGTVQGGSFRVDEQVAEGGFAVIYRAYHGAFRSNVALKCLKIPRELTEREKREFLEKFREEAQVLFWLSSSIPSVVRPLHVGTLTHTEKFVPFIALEWLEGSTLDQLIWSRSFAGEPPMSVPAVVEMLTPVAAGLCRAHRFPTPEGEVSVVHRDLKPENIFITRVHGKRSAKILDFGIAKVKSATTQMVGRQSSEASVVSGFTAAYGSPEQWSPKRYGQTGPWTDVWGLAITVVEAVCGHAPIDGDHNAMMGCALDPERRPTPRNEGAVVSDEVERIFAQALAVDPRDRFQNVGAFWNALCKATGLPQTVGDRSSTAPRASGSSRSLRRHVPPAPPAVGSPTRGGDTLPAHPDNQADDTDRAAPERSAGAAGQPDQAAVAGDVPDLIVVPKTSVSDAAVSAQPAPDAAAGKGSGVRPAATADPSAAYGSSFDSLEDDGSALPLQTPPALSGVGLGGDAGAPIVRPRASSAALRAVAPGREAAGRRLALGAPVKLLAAATLMMAGDSVYATFTGHNLQIGPFRTFWVAGPLAGIGAVLLLVRLLPTED